MVPSCIPAIVMAMPRLRIGIMSAHLTVVGFIACAHAVETPLHNDEAALEHQHDRVRQTQDAPQQQQHYTPAADLRGEWDFVPDPALPNVLILGDSISIAYTLDVRKNLQGKANVFRPMQPDKKPQNCGDTPRGLAMLDEWLGDTRWDLSHFNWGLWDLCYRHPQSKEQGGRDKVRGRLTTTPKNYERNLEKLATRLKATGAKLIWANITVVPDGEAGRFVGDDIEYNRIAARVMKRHKIPVNDLHRTSKSFPPELFSGQGDVHFSTEGSAKLAKQVAEYISNALDAR